MAVLIPRDLRRIGDLAARRSIGWSMTGSA
jgi:hypothetical protein